MEQYCSKHQCETSPVVTMEGFNLCIYFFNLQWMWLLLTFLEAYQKVSLPKIVYSHLQSVGILLDKFIWLTTVEVPLTTCQRENTSLSWFLLTSIATQTMLVSKIQKLVTGSKGEWYEVYHLYMYLASENHKCIHVQIGIHTCTKLAKL